MPDTATAPTANNAQTIAATTRMLGYYEGGGGAKVDCLIDPTHFLTKNGAGRVGLGTTNPQAVFDCRGDIWVRPAGSSAYLHFDTPGTEPTISFANQAMLRIVHNDVTEVARFTDSARLGINTTTPQCRLHVKSENEIMRLETTTARGGGGGYVGIGDPTGRKGYFGYGGGNDDMQIANELSGALQFVTGNQFRWAITAGGLFYPTSDNTYNLASASNRIKDSWFVNSPTVSCDVRFKVYRSDRQLRAAEHAAVLEIFDAFGFFQRTDGTSGRWHFGPAAQEAYSIWAKHGLCDPLVKNDKGELVPPPGAVPPAFMCIDAIEEETAPVTEGWRPSAVLGTDGQPVMVKCVEGEEATEQRPTGETIVTREAGHIFGVRIDQLHSIMLAALNAERKAQAARIAELAARIDADAA